MEAAEAVRAMLKARKETQAGLAEGLGWKSQGAVSTILARNNFTVDTLVAIANALKYEVVLRCEEPENEIILGEVIYPGGVPAKPKDELAVEIDKISEMIRGLVEMTREEAKKAEKGKKSSKGKIPLTKAGTIDGQYFDPEWFSKEQK